MPVTTLNRVLYRRNVQCREKGSTNSVGTEWSQDIRPIVSRRLSGTYLPSPKRPRCDTNRPFTVDIFLFYRKKISHDVSDACSRPICMLSVGWRPCKTRAPQCPGSLRPHFFCVISKLFWRNKTTLNERRSFVGASPFLFIFIFLLSADEFYSLGSGSFYYFYTVPSSTSRYNSGLARNSSSPLSNCIPDVKSGNDCRILGLVATADVITAALVGYQLLVRLDDDRVKVLDESILLQSQSRKTGMYTSISI